MGRWFKRFLILVLSLLVLAAAVAGGTYLWAKHEYQAPGPLAATKNVLFERGEGFIAIADKLEAEGVVRHGWLFKAAAVLSDSHHKFKAGEYEFPMQVSVAEVLRKIVEGDVVVHKVTVAEGLRTAEILALVQAEPALTGDVPKDVGEGTLLPETYHFMRGDTRESVVRRMQADMKTTLAQLWEKRDQTLPISTPEQAVTLASVVEKETGIASERPRVAAVFMNRLRIKMRLQSDPTVKYAVERDKGPLNRALIYADLEYPSPYNTYASDGLPPGPIANPGKASLAAVMNPPSTNELYFVADGTGGHAFAPSLQEHNANVAKWRAVQREEKKP